MNFGITIPFVDHLGFDLELFENGQAVVAYSPVPAHQNSYAVTHGGVVMTLLDVSMSAAARTLWEGMGAITIEMKTSFMRPTPGAGRVQCRAKVLHRTATMAFTEAGIYDEKDQLCAHATGTFKYVKPPRGSD